MPQVKEIKAKHSSALDEKIRIIMDKQDENLNVNESFEESWAKGIPAEEVFKKLEKTIKYLWQK
jgi:hypothetical protein